MKKILTLVLTLFAIHSLSAQVSVTASGYVLTPSGDPVENINVEIYTDTTATGWIYFNTVQTDANGFYSDTFDAPVTQGIAYISLFDCDGSFQSQTTFWSPADQPTADFTYCDIQSNCSVYIYQDSLPSQNGLYLIAGASGFVGNLTYSWNTGQTTGDIVVDSSGTYCVTITDAVGCTAEDCITIDIATQCYLDIYISNNGTIDAYGAGLGNISYLWNTGETTSSIQPTDAGQYCVTLTDGVGCTKEECIYYDPSNTCFVDIFLTAAGNLYAYAGGIAPITYVWNTGDSTQTIQTQGSGIYCVTVTDGVGCVTDTCYTINNPQDSCGVDITVYADSIGTTLVASAYGVAPFTYSWSTGETSNTITVIALDTLYCVTVTDLFGCAAVACADVTNTNCSNYITTSADGNSLTVFAQGNPGVGYTQVWNTGETTETISPDQIGTYCVTTTFDDGCTATSCQYWCPIWAEDCSVEIGLISFQGGQDVLKAIPDGIGPYSYLWSTGDSDNLIFPMQDGQYCVTMTDAVGCVATSCYYYETEGDSCSIYVGPSAICDFGAIATQGVAPFSFQWNTGDTTACLSPTIPGNYCVTMTDALGCEVTACEYYYVDSLACSVDIIVVQNGTYLSANATGTSPFTYDWGQYGNTQAIEIPDDGGIYCLTVVDAIGCTVVECGQFPSDSTFVCDVEILNYDSIFFSNATGVAPFSYVWSDGSTTSDITPNVPGNYCVTMTDAVGCVAVDCEYYSGGDSTGVCGVDILLTQNGTALYANAYGTPPFIYDWGGLGNSSILTPPGEGVYCVTIVDATGCSAVTCDSFLVQQNHQIRGAVWPLDSNIGVWNELVEVSLIQLNPAGSPQVIATQQVQGTPNGVYYDFGTQTAGDYLVYAELLPASPQYDDYLPTYHVSAMGWNDADIISIPNTDIYPFYMVYMIGVDGLTGGGEGEISGSVIETDEFTSGGEEDVKNLLPLEGVTMVLMDAFSQPLAYTKTNPLGQYSFGDLEWGTYQLVMEMLGHEQEIVWITIGPDNPTVTVDFTIENGEVVVTDTDELVLANSLEIWPNPTAANVQLKMELLSGSAVQLQVHDPAGQMLWQKQEDWAAGAHTQTIELSSLPNGLYFISIRTSNETIVRKVLKQ